MSSETGNIFVISGPSGSGKTTLARKLIKNSLGRLKLEKAISFCTRNPRPGEEDKKDYFFISEKEFLEKKKNGEFIEWTKYLNTFYGTSKKYLDAELKNDKNIVLCLDVNGARALRKLYPKHTATIFILPPSESELKKRVKNRGSMHAEEFRARMKLAQTEKKYAKNYDFVLVNDDLKKTLQELVNIVKAKIIPGAN